MILLAMAVTLSPGLAQAQKAKPSAQKTAGAPARRSPPKADEGGKVFPYAIHKRTLANGLDVIVIETPEFKDVLSYNTLVLSGARNETEKGKTGLAHLFEHILFRHRWHGTENGYENLMTKIGTHNNAYTWFDITFYHPLTFTSNLDRKSTRLNSSHRL